MAIMPTPVEPTDDQEFVVYQVVAARRLGFDSMMWQAPGLGLTAQAFLMTIALGPGTGRLAQITAGLLSVVVSFISIQLLMKHRLHEVADSIWLHEFEMRRRLPEVHAPGAARALSLPAGRMVRLRSHQVWITGLAVFGLVGIACSIVAVVRG